MGTIAGGPRSAVETNMNQRHLSALLVALASAPASGLAQDLSLASAVVQQPILVSIQGAGIAQQVAGPAAGANVLAGFATTAHAVGAFAEVSGQFTVSDQSLHAFFSASSNRNAMPGCGVLTGAPSLVVNVSVPRAMPVRLRLDNFVISGFGAPAPTTRIDVGNDGSADIEVRATPGQCGLISKELVIDVPEGLVPIRIDLAADIPATVAGSHCVSSGVGLAIEPAHVQVQMETAWCGATLEATPMLDGVNVRVYVGPSYPATSVFLVFGTQPTNVILPFGPNCPLLVDPIVVLPIAPMAYTSLPLAGLGPIDLLVQGVMLQPANPWLLASGVLTSQRGTLSVR